MAYLVTVGANHSSFLFVPFLMVFAFLGTVVVFDNIVVKPEDHAISDGKRGSGEEWRGGLLT